MKRRRHQCSRVRWRWGAEPGALRSRLLISVPPRVVLVLCSLLVGLALTGCSRPIPLDSFVVTQIPPAQSQEQATDALDRLYPLGSRVVLFTGPDDSVRVLSRGLVAAGAPVVSFDGARIVFAGKRAPGAEWQIYEAVPTGGSPKPLTAAPGGAMDPALLGDGSLVYVSPVPSAGTALLATNPPALYVQRSGSQARQLTFSTAPVFSPTVLSDGRILFVSVQPSSTVGSPVGCALYTINNDGTEVTAFAQQHDKATLIRRPRQLDDGRVVFLTSNPGDLCQGGAAAISMARPFAARTPLFPGLSAKLYSAEQTSNGSLLVCADPRGSSPQTSCSGAVFRLNPDAKALGTPVFFDPDRSAVEAAPIAAWDRPMGRLSNVDLSRKTGQILCLDANNTTYGKRSDGLAPKAAKIRVFTKKGPGAAILLGQVEPQADGSFMAEVPADTPLGFEALDQAGQVLRRVEPLIWVRPGENRACIGCHEPHNHSPRNFRPMAVRAPVPRLQVEPAQLAQKSPSP